MRTSIGRPSDAPDGAFVQPIVARLTLFIFGASPAAEPLLRFAKQLGWCVRIADHRPVVVSDERLSSADAPSEIALSIIAEIQAVLSRTTATALRNRHGRIHAGSDESAVVILAAGGSRRLGRPKQLVAIAGKPLIRRAAEAALSSGSGSVHVVAGAEVAGVHAALDGLPVDVVINEAWSEGMASSIRAAIEAIERRERPVESLILMLCDQPGVSADVLRRLLDAYRATRAPVVASRYPEGPGVPALFHADLFPALKTLHGDVGARQLIRHLDREVVTIPLTLPDDVDTPEDVLRYEGIRSRDQ
jgi:CTP:molybdopterin cytidylyltransferase MocA